MRTWEKDVEEWMGASVWRVGRTAEYHSDLLKIHQSSDPRIGLKKMDCIHVLHVNTVIVHWVDGCTCTFGTQLLKNGQITMREL